MDRQVPEACPHLRRHLHALPVGLRPWPGSQPSAAWATVGAGLTVTTQVPPRDCTLTVPLPVRSLLTPPPAVLALHPDCAPCRTALRTAARCLEQGAALDGGGRRRPAHRERQREQEAWRLLFARPWTASFGPPDRLDARGWRLDDEVGMRSWIEGRTRRY